MSINELEAKARELMEVRKEIEELEAMKTAIEDAIKYEMAQQGAETLTAGDYKMTWKVVTGTRFDSTAFKKANICCFDFINEPVAKFGFQMIFPKAVLLELCIIGAVGTSFFSIFLKDGRYSCSFDDFICFDWFRRVLHTTDSLFSGS